MNARKGNDSWHINPFDAGERVWKQHQTERRGERRNAFEIRLHQARENLAKKRNSSIGSEILENLYRNAYLIPEDHEEADLDLVFEEASRTLELFFAHPECTEAWQASGLMHLMEQCIQKTESPWSRSQWAACYLEFVEKIRTGIIPKLRVGSVMEDTKAAIEKLLQKSK